MKKALILLLLFSLLLCACGGTAAEEPPAAEPEPSPTPVTDGSVTDRECSVTVGTLTLRGSYSGTIAAGEPDGEGEFHGELNGRTVSFSGVWESGRAGAGTLTDSGYLVTAGERQYRGRYEGESLQGLAVGEGVFSGRNEENIDFTYSGQWENGLWNGEGELRYDSVLYYDRCGTFTAGRYTPTADELLDALGTVEPRFTVPDAVRDFISAYPELLDPGRTVPKNAEAEYSREYKSNVNYPVWFDAPDEHPETWLLLYKYEILNMVEESCFGEEYAFTRIMCSSSVYQQPVELIVFGQSEELHRDILSTWPYLTVFGIPIAKSSYVNSIGESVDTVVVLAGSLNVF